MTYEEADKILTEYTGHCYKDGGIGHAIIIYQEKIRQYENALKEIADRLWYFFGTIPGHKFDPPCVTEIYKIATEGKI